MEVGWDRAVKIQGSHVVLVGLIVREHEMLDAAEVGCEAYIADPGLFPDK